MPIGVGVVSSVSVGQCPFDVGFTSIGRVAFTRVCLCGFVDIVGISLGVVIVVVLGEVVAAKVAAPRTTTIVSQLVRLPQLLGTRSVAILIITLQVLKAKDRVLRWTMATPQTGPPIDIAEC